MTKDTPIPKQDGLTQEELDSMKPTKQLYKEYYGDQSVKTKSLLKFEGISSSSQQSSLKNLLKACFVNYTKAKEDLDTKDNYAMDKCIKSFADDFADIIVKVIQCQKVNITTRVTTKDTVVGTLINSSGTMTFTEVPPVPVADTGSGTGTAQPQQVTIL